MLGLDVQHNIISYAVVSAKYEGNKSLASSFMPLVEHLLLSLHSDYIETTSIIELYKDMYGYPIHAAILDELIKSFDKQGKIERLKGDNIQINKEKLHTYGKTQEYEASLRALIGDFHLFLKRKGKDINRGEIAKHILNFIRKNALEFNSFLQYESDLEDATESNEFTPDLIEFFLEERRNNTRNYTFICSIYSGVVLSSVMIAGENAHEVICENFSIENVLLDSNYIFRLMDLQTPLEHQAAMDTFNALKEMNCSRWVCRETLKQIADTIHRVIEQYSESVSTVLRIVGDERFTGLASACIRRDLSPAKLEGIVSKLESTLKEDFGVELIDSEEFNADYIKKTDEGFISLANIKRDASDFGIIHDLFIIDVVKAKRPKAIYKPDQAKWWVLTDDNKLTRWRSKNLSSSNVNECITESQLATIIWVCNPKTVSQDGFFNAVVALRNQGLAGGREFEKISRNIERQKKKHAEDPEALEKLALVFSQKMMQLDEIVSDDEDAVDAIFEQKMKEVEEIKRRREIVASQREHELTEEKESNKRLTAEIQTTKGLLTETTEVLVNTWKVARDEKRDEAETENKKASSAEKEFCKQVRNCQVVVSLILTVGFFCLLPQINRLWGEFYNKNQLVCNIIPSVLSLLVFPAFGLDEKFAGKLMKKLSTIIIRGMVKIKFLRNYEYEAAEHRDKAKKHLQASIELQDKIDKKLLPDS